ncbi:hypothetical protein BH10ACT11_BH10ACT11_03380 [soil metagenome]
MSETHQERFWVDVPSDEAGLSWVRKVINAIALVAIVDAVLLVVLLWASFSGHRGLVSALGPIHGAGFIALVFLCYRGVTENRWGWWFPIIVVITLGPPGSLIGDYIVRRRLP